MWTMQMVACAFVGVVGVLTPGPAVAQSSPEIGPPVASFAELAPQVVVNTGATIIVTDSTGQQVKGRLTGLSSDALAILSNGRTLTFREREVREVRYRLPDSKLEGAWIGLAAGWIVPAVVCTGRSDSSETVGCVLGTLSYGGIPGFFIGMAIDAIQAKTVTLFRSRASTKP